MAPSPVSKTEKVEAKETVSMASAPAPKLQKRIKLIIDEPTDVNNAGANTDVFIGVNGRSYLIKRGMEASVPPEVYEAIKNANITVALTEDLSVTKEVPRFAYRVLGEEYV
jgi:hypothetical protein